MESSGLSCISRRTVQIGYQSLILSLLSFTSPNLLAPPSYLTVWSLLALSLPSLCFLNHLHQDHMLTFSDTAHLPFRLP